MESRRTHLSVTKEATDTPMPSEGWVMAWAVEATTGQPRYILELDEDHRGGQCNCKCPSCDLMLTAVNAGKSVWKRRPHFRHPAGASREKCVIVAARIAAQAMFARQKRIVLPRRRKSRELEGLSGRYFNAWVEHPAETVGITDCILEDETRAILTLNDGRRLLVQLVGRGEASKGCNSNNGITAQIEIRVDDPTVANMAPEDILSRLELSWSQGCWFRHWADEELDVNAEALARAQAAAALDWIEDDDLHLDLSPAERRETLLHREVKAILERERRIRVPELNAKVDWQRTNGLVATKCWSQPEEEFTLASVELEVHLGRSVPDVLATWVTEDGWSHSMLIEVTVTNPIIGERIQRLSSFGWPALEIDIGRMGGVVTREEFTRLVVDEVAGKRWLYHPTLEEKRSNLLAELKAEETSAVEAEQRKQAIIAVPAAEWAIRYLDAVRRRWREQSLFGDRLPDTEGWRQAQADVVESIHALDEHGYPSSLLDEYPLRRVVGRILSFHDGVGIEYQLDIWGIINAILCDGAEARKWHTLYLIALKVYPPTLSDVHMDRVGAWRDNVVKSIRNEEDDYVRETTYDRMIGLLFPEMRTALMEPFGTPLYIPDRERDDDSWMEDRSYSSKSLSRPRSSSNASNNIDTRLLEASGQAASQGQSPILFAKGFASQIEELSVEQIVKRLIEMGVARTKWMWS